MITKENRIVGTAFSAEIIIKLTNPCILSVLMLLAILITGTNQLSTLIESSLALILILLVLPLGFIYLRLAKSRKGREQPIDPTLYLKRHPKDILALGILSGVPCWAVLWYLKAPPAMLATLAALLLIALIIAVANLFYRASFHMASMTVLVYMAAVIWGPALLLLAIIIPLIGWAKYRLNEHNPAQMALGIALAIAVTAGTLYYFN